MILANMTFQQFLQNPTGPYSAFFGKRENIKQDLNSRFYTLLGNTKNKDFDCRTYKKDNAYYFHIKIPSEKYKTILYDVVIKLVPQDTAVLMENTLKNYNLQFFSNSPAFVYTYAYVSKKDKLLLPFLEKKLNKQALTKPPTVKNPIEIYGFEKSIYFALLYIEYKNYHIKSAIPLEMQKNFKELSIVSDCKHSDDIMKEYNLEKQKEKARKDAEKRKLQKQKIASNNKKAADSRIKRQEKRNKVIKPKKKI